MSTRVNTRANKPDPDQIRLAYFMSPIERDDYATEIRQEGAGLDGDWYVRTGERTLSFMGASRRVYVVAYWPKKQQAWLSEPD